MTTRRHSAIAGTSCGDLIIAVSLVPAYFRDIIRGAAEFAHRAGWTVVFSDDTGLGETLKRSRPVGAIVSDGDSETINILRTHGVYGVCISSAHDFRGIPRVLADDVAMGRQAAEFFLQRGYRKLGCVGRPDRWFAWLRCKGFSETVKAAGLKCAEFPALTEWPAGWHRKEFDPAAIAEWVKRQPAPLALYHAVTDIKVILACRELGLRIPEDVALIAGDDDDIKCAASPVPLASVRMAGHRAGYVAAELINERYGKPLDEKPALVLIPPAGVISRQSADAFAIEDPAVRAAVDFIQRNARRPLQVSDAVEHCGISRRMLERRFVNVLGRTLNDEILHAHLALAKEYLSDTELSVEQVAAVSGFTSAVYMASVFRRELGITPSEYRRRFRG